MDDVNYKMFYNFLVNLLPNYTLFPLPGWLLYKDWAEIYVFVEPKAATCSLRRRRDFTSVYITFEMEQAFWLGEETVSPMGVPYVHRWIPNPKTSDFRELLASAVPPEVLLKAGIEQAAAEVHWYRKKLPRRFVLSPTGEWKQVS